MEGWEKGIEGAKSWLSALISGRECPKGPKTHDAPWDSITTASSSTNASASACSCCKWASGGSASLRGKLPRFPSPQGSVRWEWGVEPTNHWTHPFSVSRIVPTASRASSASRTSFGSSEVVSMAFRALHDACRKSKASFHNGATESTFEEMGPLISETPVFPAFQPIVSSPSAPTCLNGIVTNPEEQPRISRLFSFLDCRKVCQSASKCKQGSLCGESPFRQKGPTMTPIRDDTHPVIEPSAPREIPSEFQRGMPL